MPLRGSARVDAASEIEASGRWRRTRDGGASGWRATNPRDRRRDDPRDCSCHPRRCAEVRCQAQRPCPCFLSGLTDDQHASSRLQEGGQRRRTNNEHVGPAECDSAAGTGKVVFSMRARKWNAVQTRGAAPSAAGRAFLVLSANGFLVEFRDFFRVALRCMHDWARLYASQPASQPFSHKPSLGQRRS